MFSFEMSSVPTPRNAPPSRKKEKLRVLGSWGSCAISAISVSQVSLFGADISWAYTMPPVIAPTATVRAIVRIKFLRDMFNKSSGKILVSFTLGNRLSSKFFGGASAPTAVDRLRGRPRFQARSFLRSEHNQGARPL